MNRDTTTETILNQIVVKYKKEFGENISKEQLVKIIESQFTCAEYAMNNKSVLKLDYLGKFLIKDGRAKALTNSNKNGK